VHTPSQITYKHIHKFTYKHIQSQFTVIINIDIAKYNYIMFMHYVYPIHTYLHQKSFNKRYIKAYRRRERPWTVLGGLLPPSSDILGALALIGPSGHHHVLDGLLPPGLLLRLFWASFFRASSFFLLA
jgi:hypothetical protein